MKNFIAGQWKESENGKYSEKLEPSTGKLMGQFPSSTKNDAGEAIDAAEDAFWKWSETTSSHRASIIRKAGEIIESRRKELEDILVREAGKVRAQAVEETSGVLDQIFYYSGFERKITGDVVEGQKNRQKIFQYKVPYGVVLALTPWNFPAAMVARKLAPSLATGNTVVVKPSSDTPFTAEWIVRRFIDAGIPKGVLNLITGKGSEIGDFLVSHRKVSLVTMTGSTETGQRIVSKTSANMAKTILELGGKAPFMVWKDANLENAARALMWGKFWNAGQSCIAAERLYVHRDVREKFMKIFMDMVSRMKVGDPETSQMGPLINSGAVNTMKDFVSKATDQGFSILHGGTVPNLESKFCNGFFFEPTIIGGATQDSDVFQEEIFGPMLGVMEVEDRDELIHKANDSKYGLASYLFTSDMDFALDAADRIRFGELYINMTGPEASQGYHTGFRLTGQAGEGSKYGIEEYLKLKNVYMDYSGDRVLVNGMPGF